MSCFSYISPRSSRGHHRITRRQTEDDLHCLGPFLYHGTGRRNTDMTMLNSCVFSSYPWSCKLWKEKKMMEGVLGFIYLYVNVCMKERLLCQCIYKRIWNYKFVGKGKVRKKKRNRAQETKRMYSNENKWEKKIREKVKVTEGGKQHCLYMLASL